MRYGKIRRGLRQGILFLLSVLCVVSLGRPAAAAPALPDGHLVLQRSLQLSAGETVELPVGNAEGILWDVDGAAVRMKEPGVITALRPGVAHVTASGVEETVVFTLRILLPEEAAEGEPELVTWYEGPWSDMQSDEPFCIAVNKLKNVVTVYAKDSDGRYTLPVDVMLCSTGPDTPLGEFYMGLKLRWCDLFGDVWGQYISVIDGNILFHSVPYRFDAENTLVTEYFNLLGTSCSMGCIRLMVEDTLWIYDTCGWDTPIYIYEDEDPGPWGKPEALQLGEGCTWDPTDPHPANPWNTDLPVLNTGRKIRYAEPYSRPDLTEGITAVDSGGGDALSLVETVGTVDTSRDGEYLVTYRFTDIKGRTACGSVTYIVEGAD